MGEKSIPGFAVPDAVHQVKLVSPRKLPLRCTDNRANDSAAGTSTVSEVNSTFDGPEETPADGDAEGAAAGFVGVGGVTVGACDAGGGIEWAIGAEFADGAAGVTAGVTPGARDAGGGSGLGAGEVAAGGAAARGAAAGGPAAGATGGEDASARIGGLLSICGNTLRLLIIQKAPPRSRIIPAATAAAKKDFDSLREGGSRRSLIGANRFAAPLRSNRSSHPSTSAGRCSRSQRRPARSACH